MRIQVLRLITTWILGVFVGTVLIAATSPLFVRSYLPQHVDPVRGITVPEPGSSYRWRSEGYATTLIGPHGMPGRTSLPVEKDSGAIRVALWGDSQAEGVCVADQQKLFAQVERVSSSAKESIVVLPFARSGDDAGDWLKQIPKVELELAIDVHVLMIVDLGDLLVTDREHLSNSAEIEFQSAIASRLPAFVIQAGRNLVTDNDGERRRLRFAVGPIDQPWHNIVPDDDSSPSPGGESDWNIVWQQSMRNIRRSSERPIIILYAPQTPSITGGYVNFRNDSAEQFRVVSRAATTASLILVDARAALNESALAGRWPHGFHNGQFGSGHLNADGYRVIARELAPAIIEIVDGKD